MNIKSTYLVFLFFLVSLSGFGQTEKDFERIFEKETQAKESGKYGSERFKNVTQLSFYPDTLPTWFFSLPASSSGKVYALGISDPDLTVEEASAQALHRAKSMAILFEKAKIQFFRDVYTTEQVDGRYTTYRQRFDTYFKISAAVYANDENFSIVNQHLTRYNEAIVLISYTPLANISEKATQMLSSVGTVLFIEAQVGDAFEPQAEYELLSAHKKVGELPQNGRFLYREKGNRFLSMSEFLDVEYSFPLYNYKYCSPLWPANTMPLICYSGLWSYYTREMLKYLTISTEQAKIKIRTLGSTKTSDNANLSREIAIMNAKVHLIGIDFGVDSIGFNINLQELQ